MCISYYWYSILSILIKYKNAHNVVSYIEKTTAIPPINPSPPNIKTTIRASPLTWDPNSSSSSTTI